MPTNVFHISTQIMKERAELLVGRLHAAGGVPLEPGDSAESDSQEVKGKHDGLPVVPRVL